MRVKTIICVLGAFFFLSISAYAQDGLSSDEITGKIQADANLNQEQLVKVRLIIKENLAKREQIKQQSDLGLTQAQADPLNSELYTNLSEVLTSSQMVQWDRILDLMLQNTDENKTGK